MKLLIDFCNSKYYFSKGFITAFNLFIRQTPTYYNLIYIFTNISIMSETKHKSQQDFILIVIVFFSFDHIPHPGGTFVIFLSQQFIQQASKICQGLLLQRP